MAEKESDPVTCPNCSSRNVRVLSQKENFRPWSRTGNLKTDLTPISTTVSYKCQDPNCGHEWETTSL
jgi:DNA-directed RNA polymerase subunit RPC12/RpoP